MAALGINIVSIFIYSLLFLVVYLIINKFLSGPLLSILEKRRLAIDSGLQQAEAAAKERENISKEKEAILAAAKKEAQQAFTASKKDAEAEKAKYMEKAKKEADAIVFKANERLEVERKKLQDDYRVKLEAQAVAIAKEVYQIDKVSIDKKLIDQAINQL
ncbi:MAG: ATP synthase F0 subunit B [bacterium]